MLTNTLKARAGPSWAGTPAGTCFGVTGFGGVCSGASRGLWAAGVMGTRPWCAQPPPRSVLGHPSGTSKSSQHPVLPRVSTLPLPCLRGILVAPSPCIGGCRLPFIAFSKTVLTRAHAQPSPGVPCLWSQSQVRGTWAACAFSSPGRVYGAAVQSATGFGAGQHPFAMRRNPQSLGAPHNLRQMTAYFKKSISILSQGTGRRAPDLVSAGLFCARIASLCAHVGIDLFHF